MTVRHDLIILTLLLGSFFLCLLGHRTFTIPDEGRYAEIPREMLVSQDYITPRLNTIKYFEKPPLFYWMQTVSLRNIGMNEWGARIPTALMALFGCLATYLGGRILFDRRTGLFASGILATSVLYFGMARLNTLDMTLTGFLTAALLCFLIGETQKNRPLIWGGYVFTAFAVLTKGLVGIILPALIIAMWLLITTPLFPLSFPAKAGNRVLNTLASFFTKIKNFHILSGIIIFLTITLPWHILVQLKNPEFAYFYFIEQHLLRYLDGADRLQPFWFFYAILFIGFLPWIFFLIPALRNLFRRIRTLGRLSTRIEIFLLLWAGIVFIFFNFSQSKLIPYLLPMLPPLAIITAYYLALRWSNRTMLIVLSATAITLLTILITIPHIDDRSTKPLIMKLKTILKPQDTVLTYAYYYQELPFYLQRPVKIVGWTNELTYGMQHEDVQNIMWTNTELWQRWQSSEKIFMMTERRLYELLLKQMPFTFHLVAATKRVVLLSNHHPN